MIEILTDFTDEQIADACERVSAKRPEYDFSQVVHAVASVNHVPDHIIQDAWARINDAKEQR